MYEDIKEFHSKFGLLPEGPLPLQLDWETFNYRLKFMQEELDEFTKAWTENDIEEQADALVDLVYVALGTACFMGLPFEALWEEVHRANMSKERAQKSSDSARGTTLDVVKPPGWRPPSFKKILDEVDFRQGKLFDKNTDVFEQGSEK